MNDYTSQLKKRQPQLDDDPWYQDWYENEQINDVVMAALLAGNRVLSGGAVTAGTGLNADIAALAVLVGGTTYPSIAGATLALTPAAVGAEQVNWVYVSDTGVITVSTTPPAGAYVPLALVDTNDAAVVRIADLRPMAGNSVWTALTLENSWVTHTAGQELSYKKMADGTVYVTGEIKNGTRSLGTQICLFDTGARPGRNVYVACYIQDGDIYNDGITANDLNIFLLLKPDGTLSIVNQLSVNAKIGISFSFIAEN